MVAAIKSEKALTAPRSGAGKGIRKLPVAGYTHRWDALMYPQPNEATVTELADLVGGSTLTGNAPMALKSPASNMRAVRGEATVRMTGTITNIPQPYTIVTVAKINTAGASVILAAQATGATSQNGITRIGSTATVYEMDSRLVGGTGAATLLHTKTVDTNHHVFICVFDGTNSVFSIDGVEVTGNAGTQELADRLAVFAYPNASSTFPGESSDITIYPRRLTTTERASVAARLAPVPPYNVDA